MSSVTSLQLFGAFRWTDMVVGSRDVVDDLEFGSGVSIKPWCQQKFQELMDSHLTGVVENMGISIGVWVSLWFF